MSIASLFDVIYCMFPTEEGGTLAHYGLVSGIEQRMNGEWYAHIIYATSKKIDVASNGAKKSVDFVVTPTNFGESFWKKTGLSLKAGMTGTCFQCNKTAWIPARSLKKVGALDSSHPSAFNALRNAVLNANY